MLITDLTAIGTRLFSYRKRIGMTQAEVTEEAPMVAARQEELWSRMASLSPKDRETALRLLEVYLQSLE